MMARKTTLTTIALITLVTLLPHHHASAMGRAGWGAAKKLGQKYIVHKIFGHQWGPTPNVAVQQPGFLQHTQAQPHPTLAYDQYGRTISPQQAFAAQPRPVLLGYDRWGQPVMQQPAPQHRVTQGLKNPLFGSAAIYAGGDIKPVYMKLGMPAALMGGAGLGALGLIVSNPFDDDEEDRGEGERRDTEGQYYGEEPLFAINYGG